MEFLFLILVAILIVYFFKNKAETPQEIIEPELPFRRKEFLMNIPERKFFEELRKIIPDNYEVFPQVVLGSIVYPVGSGNEFMKLRNKINRKIIDFVIFEKPYFKPVLGIEYDGKTHDYPDRVNRDIEVQEILDSAGIKNFHVRHRDNINFEEIKNKINELLIPTSNHQITSVDSAPEVQKKVH